MIRRIPAPLHGVRSSLPNGIVHSHFSVQGNAPQHRLLAWRERVGHVIDVLPSRADLEQPFAASIDRYEVGNIVFTDCRSDAMLLDRTLARISTDKVRDFVFHLFLEGDVEDIQLRAAPRRPVAARMLALDMGQPVRMRRNACRVLTFFVPGSLVEEVFPDPEAIHGRTIEGMTPLAGLAVDHIAALGRGLRDMRAADAQEAVQTGAQLLIAAFGKEAGLSGSTRAAARAAMFGQVRRHVQANLHRADLSPDSVLSALNLPRPTMYRLFQHEGGLGAFIRHLRLRHAADDLVRYPHLMVTDAAYGLGFKSASDFTRAFRRAYGMSPQDFRALAIGKAP